jgi:alpha-L-fucosidase
MNKRIILRKTIIAFIAIVFTLKLSAQETNKMEWFSDAKLGIFIHWGIYSLGNTSESWAFHNKRISHSDYMAQADSFSAVNYNPEYWAEIIKNSGARYSVITSKHHDGVALWDTKQNNISTLHITPAKKDVLTPFVSELRKRGVKVGIYFSLIVWTDTEYPDFSEIIEVYNFE